MSGPILCAYNTMPAPGLAPCVIDTDVCLELTDQVDDTVPITHPTTGFESLCTNLELARICNGHKTRPVPPLLAQTGRQLARALGNSGNFVRITIPGVCDGWRIRATSSIYKAINTAASEFEECGFYPVITPEVPETSLNLDFGLALLGHHLLEDKHLSPHDFDMTRQARRESDRLTTRRPICMQLDAPFYRRRIIEEIKPFLGNQTGARQQAMAMAQQDLGFSLDDIVAIFTENRVGIRQATPPRLKAFLSLLKDLTGKDIPHFIDVGHGNITSPLTISHALGMRATGIDPYNKRRLLLRNIPDIAMLPPGAVANIQGDIVLCLYPTPNKHLLVRPERYVGIGGHMICVSEDPFEAFAFNPLKNQKWRLVACWRRIGYVFPTNKFGTTQNVVWRQRIK